METELLPIDYSDYEVEEKVIRRSDLIRAKYGTLANFLKTLINKPVDAESATKERSCSGELPDNGRA